MRDRAQLDDFSLRTLTHLEAYVNGDSPVDDALLRDYINYVEADRAVVTGNGDILESAVLTSFVPLLSRILSSDLFADIFAELLTAMLVQLPFADTLKFFPLEAVIQALESPADAVVFMAIHVIRVNLAREDPDVGRFLAHSTGLQLVTSRTLTSSALPTKIVSDVEVAVQLYARHETFDISAWLFLQEIHDPTLVDDATLLGRYLAILQALQPKLPADLLATLSHFDMKTILGQDVEKADPFVSSQLIDFYTQLIGQVPIASIPVDQCMIKLVQMRQLHQNDFIVYPALTHLYATLSRNEASRDYVEKLIRNHAILAQFDFSSDDIQLFLKLDIGVIGNKRDFFDENFSAWSFQLSSYPRFRCLLHLIDNEEFFGLLVESKKLEDDKLSKLPQNLVYELLDKLTGYDYSANFLLQNLPYTMLTHLMANDPGVVNPEIWSTKQQALQNLLLYRKVDLGVWHQGLAECYKEMLHGRDIKSIEAKVEVTDEAM